MSGTHFFTASDQHRQLAQSILDTATEPLALIDARGKVLASSPGYERALRARAQFLSIASHDLRGALSNVRSYASLLLAPRYGLEGKARDGVAVILRNADRVLGLVRDVFDSLRQELGCMPMHQVPTPLGPVLRRAIELASNPLAEAKVQLTALLPDALPSLPLDAERISHAVSCFLLHSAKRSPEGSNITLSTRVDGNRVWVEVRDRGPPLGKDQVAQAFDRDRRVSEDKRLGAGFLLSIARDEIEAHGGSCGVLSGAEQTTYFFTLSQTPEGGDVRSPPLCSEASD